MEWTSGQKECIHLANRWLKKQDKQVFQYSGPAGTGKTTIMPEILSKSKLDVDTEVLCMAFTGRAASNLSLKGLPASSMHSALMDCVTVPKKDENGREIYANGRKVTTWQFVKKEFLPRSIKLLVIDEGLFVGTEMGQIAESFGLPICVMGDTEQLGPLYGKPYFLNYDNIDYTLDEITRQAKGSGIIELATRIRLGQELPRRKYRFKDDAFIIPKKEITDTVLLNSDIILCGKNRTRNYFNKRIREDILGIDSKLPVKGDKLICRHNYWGYNLGGISLTNGIIGHVINTPARSSIDLKSNTIKIDFRPDYIDYDYYENLPVDIGFFQADCGPDKKYDPFSKGMKFELGHAITVHVSQGSQFDTATYWDEPNPMMSSDLLRRIRYTAATRASQLLVYAV